MNIHKSIHSGEKSQICKLCHRSFYRKDHLQKHLQTHNKWLLQENMLNPNEIEVEIKEEMDIKQEVDDGINVVITDVAGNVCDTDYIMKIDPNTAQHCEESQEANSSTTDTNETYIVNPNSDRPFICTVCNKSYKRKDHLKLHSVTHMAKDKVCSECGKAFHKEEQLLVHMNIHLNSYSGNSGNFSTLYSSEDNTAMSSEDDNNLLVPRTTKPDRPHECPVCHRKFKRKQHLKVHANLHLKHQPTVWCSVCSLGFFTNVEYQSHKCVRTQKIEHVQFGSNNEKRPATSDLRNENHPLEFVEVTQDENGSHNDNSDENSQHVTETLTTELGLPFPQRVFVCKYCSKPFRRRDHYKIHQHVHTGVKSFFCPDCGKGFYRKDHLQKHGLVHAKVKLAKQKDRNEKQPIKAKKQLPGLYPINGIMNKSGKLDIKPEITIHAPSNTKLRLPLQIKVPYQMVMSMENGEQRAVTIDPQATVTEDST